MNTAGEVEELLAEGELTVVGRIPGASNAVLLCTAAPCGLRSMRGRSRIPHKVLKEDQVLCTLI